MFWITVQQGNSLNSVLEMAELEESLETIYSTFSFHRQQLLFYRRERVDGGLGMRHLAFVA
jgi:hypothetical protein